MHGWTAHYDSEVPSTLEPYPDGTLLDFVKRNALERPAEPAILFKGSSLSNADLEDLSDRFAGALRRLGVKPGDRVALLLPNAPQFLIAELGIWKAGAVAYPLNPLYTAGELAGPLRDADVHLVIALTPFYDRV
jgi:long-chain acyl-CoA synthetase